MESDPQGFSFGDFNGLSVEEQEHLFQILHGPRPDRKVEFPWDDADLTYGATGGLGEVYTQSWVDQMPEYAGGPQGQFAVPVTGCGAGPMHPMHQNSPIQYGYSHGEPVMVDPGYYGGEQMAANQQYYYESAPANQDLNIGEVPTNQSQSEAVYRDSVGRVEYQFVEGQVPQAAGFKPPRSQSTGKPYERRNKKKRPANYYNQDESGSGSQGVEDGATYSLQQPLQEAGHMNIQQQAMFRSEMHVNLSQQQQQHPSHEAVMGGESQHWEYGHTHIPQGGEGHFVPIDPRYGQVNTGIQYSGPPEVNPTYAGFPPKGQRMDVDQTPNSVGELKEIVVDPNTKPEFTHQSLPLEHQHHMPERTSTGENQNGGDHSQGVHGAFQQDVQGNSAPIIKRAEVSVNDDSSLGDAQCNFNNIADSSTSARTDISMQQSVHLDTNNSAKKISEQAVAQSNIAPASVPVSYAGESNSGSVVVGTGSVVMPPTAPPVSETLVSNDMQHASQEPVKPKTTSWAGLFKKEGGNQAIVIQSYRQSDTYGPVAKENKVENKKVEEVNRAPVPAAEDSAAKELGDMLSKMTISHSSIALQPRGLINRGNWCYINATLQALVACPPLYNVLKKMPKYPALSRGPSSTPILDSIIEFINEFSVMPRMDKGKGKKHHQELSPGLPFEPMNVYKMLQSIAANPDFKLGKQEDAEEFLSCIFNGMHEEMSAAIRLKEGPLDNSDVLGGTEDCVTNGYLHVEDGQEEDSVEDESWEQVGPKKKSVQTRRAEFAKSPIADIFAGLIRSVVYKSTSKETATLEPFFTLQLDIQSEKVWSVKDALEGLVSKESVSGYTCSKTNSELEVVRKLSLEQLPPVLVLHLKFFVYNKDGGCQKVMKKVDYGVDLEITKDLLSPNARAKLSFGQRTYKLFAVVYHHGKSATGGHYTTNVFHPGINGWVNSDDSMVKSVALIHVLKYMPPRVPYLLYYRRVADSH